MEHQITLILNLHYRQAEGIRKKLEKLSVEQRVGVEGMVREYFSIPPSSRKRELRTMIALIIGCQPNYTGKSNL